MKRVVLRPPCGTPQGFDSHVTCPGQPCEACKQAKTSRLAAITAGQVTGVRQRIEVAVTCVFVLVAESEGLPSSDTVMVKCVTSFEPTGSRFSRGLK